MGGLHRRRVGAVGRQHPVQRQRVRAGAAAHLRPTAVEAMEWAAEAKEVVVSVAVARVAVAKEVVVRVAVV